MKTLVLITSLFLTSPLYTFASGPICIEHPFSFEILDICDDDSDESKEILAKVEEKFNSLNSFQANFQLRMENIQSQIDETQAGSIFLDRITGNYRVETREVVMITSQKEVHTILLNEGEVIIDNYDPDESEFSPAKLYTVYKNDYKSESKPDQEIDGFDHAVIDLTPNSSSSPYHKVRLYVNRTNFLITKGVVFEKNDTQYTYKLTEFEQNPDLSERIFNYDAREFPSFEEVDLR